MYSLSKIVLFSLFGLISSWKNLALLNFGVAALSPSAPNIIERSDDATNSSLTLQQPIIQKDSISLNIKKKWIAPKTLQLILGVVIVISAAYFVARCLKTLGSKKANLRRLAEGGDNGVCEDADKAQKKLELQDLEIKLAKLKDQLNDRALLVEDWKMEIQILGGKEFSPEDLKAYEWRKEARERERLADERREKCKGMTKEQLEEEQKEYDELQKKIAERQKEIAKEEKKAAQDKAKDEKKEAKRIKKLQEGAAKGDKHSIQVLTEIREQNAQAKRDAELQKKERIQELKNNIETMILDLRPLLTQINEMKEKRAKQKLIIAHPKLNQQQIVELHKRISQMKKEAAAAAGATTAEATTAEAGATAEATAGAATEETARAAADVEKELALLLEEMNLAVQSEDEDE